MLSRAAWGYVRDAHDHADLMQEILLAVWRSLPRFRGDASERTFVLRIAHNRGVSFALRRQARRTGALSDDTPDPRPLAHDQIIQAQRVTGLLAAVQSLREPARQAVMLQLEGLSTREIAEVQGISENAAAVRLTRARASLRALLDGQDL